MKKTWKLSVRQIEVLQLAATGLTSKEIACVLHISHKTVDVHFDRAMGEMGAKNRLQAVVMFDRAKRPEPVCNRAHVDDDKEPA